MPRQSTLAEPISTRQEAFARSMRERITDFGPLDPTQLEIGMRLWGPENERGPVTKEEASYLISGMMRCPQTERTVTVKEGYYWHEGRAYQVVTSDKGNLYAKVLVRIGQTRAKDYWRYSASTIYDLTPAEKVTLAAAIKRHHSVAPR